MFLPWLCVRLFNLSEMNQTVLYVILLIPMFIATYYSGLIVNRLIDTISKKIERKVGLGKGQ